MKELYKTLIWIPGLFWMFLFLDIDEFDEASVFLHGAYTGIQTGIILLCILFFVLNYYA